MIIDPFSPRDGFCLLFVSFFLLVVFGNGSHVERVVSFVLSLGILLVSMGFFNIARNFCCLSRLKPDKVFERILKRVSLWLEVAQIEN